MELPIAFGAVLEVEMRGIDHASDRMSMTPEDDSSEEVEAQHEMQLPRQEVGVEQEQEHEQSKEQSKEQEQEQAQAQAQAQEQAQEQAQAQAEQEQA